MTALPKDTVYLSKFVRKLPGGSQPILCRASDGQFYVVKFSDNLQGANLLFNESIGTELYRASGLFVPFWRPLLITDSFLDGNPSCWMETSEGNIRPRAGLCFGSRYLGGNGSALLEILPSSSFMRVSNHTSFWLAWMIDICAEHADNRQAIFLQNRQGRLRAFFFDQGCLFGGAKGELRPHFLTSRYLDPRMYQELSLVDMQVLIKAARSVDVDGLWQRMHELPECWSTKSAIERFERCLGRLTDVELLQNIADTMVYAIRKGAKCDERTPCIEPRFPILCSTIHAARSKSYLGCGIASCAASSPK